MDVNLHSDRIVGYKLDNAWAKIQVPEEIFCFEWNQAQDRLASVVVAGWLSELLASYITDDFLWLVNVKIKLRSVLNS